MTRAVWVTAAIVVSLFAATAHAQPGQTPPSPPAPAPEPDDFDQRGGVTLGLALGGGSHGVMFGVEVGALVRNDVAIIGTATALVRSDDDGGSFGFLGLGARYWIHHIFVDAELGRVTRSSFGCAVETACSSDHAFGSLATVGFELAQTQHFGLDVHASTLVAFPAHDITAVWFAGMGVHAYF